MTVRNLNNVECWNGPPVWILSPAWAASIRKNLPPAIDHQRDVEIEMLDGKKVLTTVIADRLVMLPEPYTCRDLKVVRNLR